MSETSLMTIRELIDMAFGDVERNKVNFKLIQTVLFLLARQLKILERQVPVNASVPFVPNIGSGFSVSELKMHTITPKKKRKHGIESFPTEPSREFQDSKQEDTKSDDKIKDSKNKEIEEKYFRQKSDKISIRRTSHKYLPSEISASDDKLTEKDTREKATRRDEEGKYSTESRQTRRHSTTKTVIEKSYTHKYATHETVDKGLTGKATERYSTKNTDKTTFSKRSSTAKGKTTDGKKNYKASSSSSESYQKIKNTVHSIDRKLEPESAESSIESSEDEVKYEKVLVVKRQTAGDKKTEKIPKQSSTVIDNDGLVRTLASYDQFESLVEQVIELQKLFSGTPGLEKYILTHDLRTVTSVSDPRAALQLASRLDRVEDALEEMMNILAHIAKKTQVQEFLHQQIGVVKKAGIIGEPLIVATSHSQSRWFKEPIVLPVSMIYKSAPSETVTVLSMTMSEGPESTTIPTEQRDLITFNDLNAGMEDIHNEFFRTLHNSIARSDGNAENALKVVGKMETKVQESLNLGEQMMNLETLVLDYSQRVTNLDAGLSKQMTSYQEDLTQMQHELEVSLDIMAEAIANPKSDSEGIAELDGRFTFFTQDLTHMMAIQKDFIELQKQKETELENVWKDIKKLQECKSDRSDVTEALRDKAGIDILNGIVNREQFDAVRGDLEKKISSAYDKFNHQELLWQKSIDDLQRDFNDKCDRSQVNNLKADVAKNLEMLRKRLEAMEQVLGEPRLSSTKKIIFRDRPCLSCDMLEVRSKKPGKPESMTLTKGLSNFTKSPSIVGRETHAIMQEQKQQPQPRPCYPGLPIPHPKDPRSLICSMHCAGTCKRIDSELLSQMTYHQLPEPSTDHEFQAIEKQKMKIPCIPCNVGQVSSFQELQTLTNGIPLILDESSEVTEDHHCHYDLRPEEICLCGEAPTI